MIFFLVAPVLIVAALLFWAGWRKCALAAILGPLAVAGVVYSVIYDNKNPEIGEGLVSVKWLPASASNINYVRSYSFSAYEFTISPEEFLAYAKEREWELTKIGKKKGIRRYLFKLEQLGRKVDPIDTTATARSGYAYGYQQANGGGISVIYDLEAQRAYVEMSPR